MSHLVNFRDPFRFNLILTLITMITFWMHFPLIILQMTLFNVEILARCKPGVYHIRNVHDLLVNRQPQTEGAAYQRLRQPDVHETGTHGRTGNMAIYFKLYQVMTKRLLPWWNDPNRIFTVNQLMFSGSHYFGQLESKSLLLEWVISVCCLQML